MVDCYGPGVVNSIQSMLCQQVWYWIFRGRSGVNTFIYAHFDSIVVSLIMLTVSQYCAQLPVTNGCGQSEHSVGGIRRLLGTPDNVINGTVHSRREGG